jgi:hypothetical protein
VTFVSVGDRTQDGADEASNIQNKIPKLKPNLGIP